MSKLRKYARDKECQIRLEGICNGNSETVVLCHLNGGGMGAKVDDRHGAHGCSSCHDEVDRRTRNLESDFVKIALLEGVIRTQDLLIREGLM